MLPPGQNTSGSGEGSRSASASCFDASTGDNDGGDAWMAAMRRGDFEQAWRVSDRVMHERAGQPCWHWPRHLQYIWDGTPLAGRRVLVRCYHGLGDTIQFIRFVPLLSQIAASVVVWAQPALLPLLATLPDVGTLLPLHDGVPEVEHDVDVELMELPHVFRTTWATLPARVPYLHVRAGARSRVGESVMNVGVVWRSGGWDERRSVPAALMARLADVPEVRLFVLQDRAATADWPKGVGARISTEPVTALAEAIAAMDLVVTVDTLAAHLGGALGKPTWTLLPRDSDWRWMDDREDSPWYSTMRLFRQGREGAWEPVVERVMAELRRMANAWGTRRHTAV